ncbi:hypothetical protein CLOP_g3795 [Closterium sp. NIES-67]|nr:hypothetical protein CLOP_g3795 [Closterium sp. NIES-67]
MASLPRFDFGFAFREPAFSDCVLRLVIEPHLTAAADEINAAEDTAETSNIESLHVDTAGISSSAAPAAEAAAAAAAAEAAVSPSDPSTRDVPAASVVLASKSSFFRALFTSGFSETVDRRMVHIHLSREEEPLMMELLQYIYRGTLPPDTVTSFERTLQLLLLADRFGVDECISTCSSLLTSLTSLPPLHPHPSSSSSSTASSLLTPSSTSIIAPSLPPSSSTPGATVSANPPLPASASNTTSNSNTTATTSSTATSSPVPSSITTQQALLVLSLPPSLRLNPLLAQLIRASQACIVHHYGPQLNNLHHYASQLHSSAVVLLDPHHNHFHHHPHLTSTQFSTPQLTNPHLSHPAAPLIEFLSIPEAGMRALLESDDLPVDSEESVFCALILWARHRFPGGKVALNSESTPGSNVGIGGEVALGGRAGLGGSRAAGLEERRAVVGRLVREVRWAWVGAGFVRAVALDLEEMQSEEARGVVLEGLFAAAQRGEEISGVQTTSISPLSLQFPPVNPVTSPPLLPPLPPPPIPFELVSAALSVSPPAFTRPTNSAPYSSLPFPTLSSPPTHTLSVPCTSLSASPSHQLSQSLHMLSSPASPPSWSRPRTSYRPPRKSLFLEIPLSQCQGWTPSVSFQATSGLFCIAGRWFTLNAKLECQKELGPRFGLFLRLDKHATFPGVAAESVNCQYRFCVKMDLGGGSEGQSSSSSGTDSGVNCRAHRATSSGMAGASTGGSIAGGTSASAAGSVEGGASGSELGVSFLGAAAAATTAAAAASTGGDVCGTAGASAISSCGAPIGGVGNGYGRGSVGYCVVKSRSGCVFSEPYHGWGSRDLFKKSWDEVLAAPDVFFPEGAMHFRADIWID